MGSAEKKINTRSIGCGCPLQSATQKGTGAASWKAATFSMEETDIVRGGGWCEWLRTVPVRRRRTKSLGSTTPLAKIHYICHWIRRFMGTVVQLDSDKEHTSLTLNFTNSLTCSLAGRYSCHCFMLLPQILKKHVGDKNTMLCYIGWFLWY